MVTGVIFGVLDEKPGSGSPPGRPCDRGPATAGPGSSSPPSEPAGLEDGCGFDPIDFGYPATREFLDEHAERPEKWNPDHSVYGVFSYPTYLLDQSRDGSNDGTEPTSSITVSNNLLVDVEIEVVLSVSGAGAWIDGGEVVWMRTSDGTTDVRIRATVPMGQEVSVSAHSI